MNPSTFLLILLILEATNADIAVRTTRGPVRGTTVASGKVEAFLGIPYAEPPVGPLRFKKPITKGSWEEVYDANTFPNACIQSSYLHDVWPDPADTSEDCLYINVWVPHSDDRSELKPIIIYIHGGGFMLGSSSQTVHDGAALAEHGDIIVATINYRLGGLGFFTSFTDDAPGNLGMHDQVAAIRWMKENAENFQGDPNNIVLMGESAGSMSISTHLISPLSKSLFKRAILLSGSLLHPRVSDNNDNLSKLCQKYAEFMGCTANGETLESSPKSITECMKNLPTEKFAEVDTKIITNLEVFPRDLFSLILYPRVGDDFLPENTIDSFRKGDFKDTEIVIGITRDEGSSLLTEFTPNLFGIFGERDITPFFNDTSTMQYIRGYIRSNDESEDDKIIQTYMNRVNEDEEYAYVKALSDAVGDYVISCSAVFQADIHSLGNSPIYFYIFDFVSPFANHGKWMGVPHGEDIQYVLGNLPDEYSEPEREFSRDIMDRLAAFARTGNPNIPKAVTWPRYTLEDPKYIVLGKQDTVKTKPDRDRCGVWRKRFGSVVDEDLIRSLRKTKS